MLDKQSIESQTIKLFTVGSLLRYTLFDREDSLRLFKREGIVLSEEAEADLVVCGTVPRLMPLILKHGSRKKYLIWTNEPRVSPIFSPTKHYPFLPKIHVFNPYTGLYQNNYARFPNKTITLPHLTDFQFKHRKMAALMVYRNDRKKWSLKYQGNELDLCYLRTQIALEGYHRGMADCYGQKWPPDISSGESRSRKWRKEKLQILQNYHFNLAFENTNWPYYCTEKIWDAIRAQCLPIYYGKGNKIYEDFPQDSFLDYSDFQTPGDLFNYVQSMSEKEFINRMNLCVDTFNRLSHEPELLKGKLSEAKQSVKKIREIVGENP